MYIYYVYNDNKILGRSYQKEICLIIEKSGNFFHRANIQIKRVKTPPFLKQPPPPFWVTPPFLKIPELPSPTPPPTHKHTQFQSKIFK